MTVEQMEAEATLLRALARGHFKKRLLRLLVEQSEDFSAAEIVGVTDQIALTLGAF